LIKCVTKEAFASTLEALDFATRQKYNAWIAKGRDAARSRIHPCVARDECCRRARQSGEGVGKILADIGYHHIQDDELLPALGNCNPSCFLGDTEMIPIVTLRKSGRPIVTPSTWFFSKAVKPSST
jgi:hypothetical protein